MKVKVDVDYTDLILQYKGKHPDLSQTRLAQLIAKEQKLNVGWDYFRKIISDVLTPKTQNFNFTQDDFKIPESYYEDYPDFVIPKSVNNFGIIGDIHIPYHDKFALKTSLEYLRDQHINGLLLNGDILDFCMLSRFSKSFSAPKLYQEIELGKQFFTLLRNIFPDIPIYFKLGNHEERLNIFICDKASVLEKIAGLEFRNLLELDKYRIELIENQRTVVAGKLSILHGHELKKGSGGVNIARAVRLATLTSIFVGHWHRTQDDFARSLDSKAQGGFACGCLCGLRPQWLPINNWNHGFAVVKTETDGHFEVDNKKIIDGKIL